MMDPKVAIEELRTSGFTFVGQMKGFQEFRDHLLGRYVYLDAHVPETARKNGRHPVPRSISGASECVCVENHDVIRAPHFLEVGMALTSIAGAYLEKTPPVAFSMNAFWTRPGPAGSRPDIQEFHEDRDDTRFLALFCFLTDVMEPDDGPQDLRGPDGTVRTIYGPAGTLFLADTSRPHRGRKPTSRERGLAWYRWGVSDIPPAYQWDKNTPIAAAELGDRYPTDPHLRKSIELIAS